MKFVRLIVVFFLITFWHHNAAPVLAQSDPPKLPIYIVQAGDSLNLIALKFNVSAEDIVAVNSLPDPNILQVNTQLVIPGIEGAEGLLSFEPMQLGATPLQIARQYNIQLKSLYKLNRITTPSELFLGANVILVDEGTENNSTSLYSLKEDETGIEAAIIHAQNPWLVPLQNQNMYTWQVISGEELVFANPNNVAPTTSVTFEKLPLKQGKSSAIIISGGEFVASAELDGMPIEFYRDEGSTFAIFGIHAMKDPGLYPFHMEYEDVDGKQVFIDQLLLVQSGFYPKDPVLSVDPATLDAASTQPEEDLVNQIYSLHSDQKLWNDLFQWPTDDPCIKSGFGNRRSYNGGPYDRYHTGVDLGVCANLNIYAPADGIVVFSGPLIVRGNATIIDHGMGVFTGFWHQSKTFVEVGQTVQAHDLIGEIGSTGRSTGPHLHWEMIVNGISVNALDWLDVAFP